MGYDCTLHVIDPKLTDGPYTDLLLGGNAGRTAFHRREDAGELLATIRKSLEADSPPLAAQTVAQGALLFCAAELPYHYERQFALSLWEDQPDGLDARVPNRFFGDVNDLFTRLIAAQPQLAKQFTNRFASNFSTGCYVPAENVPGLLKWVQRKVAIYPKPERRVFRGLLLILEAAAARGLAYWEGTDLPLEMRTVMPPESERATDLLDARMPEGYWDLLGRFGDTLVFADTAGSSLIVDVAQWPPACRIVPEYWVHWDARTASGPFVTVALAGTTEYEVRGHRTQQSIFEVRARNVLADPPSSTLPLEGRQPPNGPWRAAYFNGRVVAEPIYINSNSGRRVPMWEGNDGILHPLPGISAAADRHGERADEQHVDLAVMRLDDGADVLLWHSKGYELRNDKAVETFDLSKRPWRAESSSDGHGREYAFSYVPCGADGAYLILDGRVVLARRGVKPEAKLLPVTNAMYLTPGPEGSIIVDEGETKTGRLGVIWWPEQERFVAIEPELFEDEDPEAILSLHLDSRGERLLAFTSERVWSRPIEHALRGPAYSAATGRKLRQ